MLYQSHWKMLSFHEINVFYFNIISGLVLFFIFVIVNKSHEKTESINALIHLSLSLSASSILCDILMSVDLSYKHLCSY